MTMEEVIELNNKNIGQLIKTARGEKGLTQAELARKARLSRSYIADIEQGRYTPSLKTSVALAKILSLDLNLLTGMTDIQIAN